MIKNPILRNDNGGAYTEVFDIERLREIAEMAKVYAKNDSKGGVSSKGVPDGRFSDFEVNVWEIMVELIRYGRRELNREDI